MLMLKGRRLISMWAVLVAVLLLTGGMEKLGGGALDICKVAEDMAAFMWGLTGNIATEMDLEVGDLAATARRSAALVGHLQQHPCNYAIGYRRAKHAAAA